MDGNNGMGGYSQPNYAPQKPITPGKNITSLILGIHSLYFAVFAAAFGWIPLYGIIYSVIFGLCAIGCAIPVFILTKQIVDITGELSKKPSIGKKLSIAGIIVSIIAFVISIVVILAIILIFGAGALATYAGTSSYYMILL